MAQTFATNASEALVGADVGAEGSHKLSWQQASSQLVRSPVIFTKVHAAKKNQKCIQMKKIVQCSANKYLPNRANIIVCPKPRTYMRTHTPEKRTRKWFSPLFVRPPPPPRSPPPPRPSTPNKQPQCSVLCHLKDDVNIIGYICKPRCQGQWRHLTWRSIFFSTCVSIINEQLLKWIRCPRVASILTPLPLPCKS